MYSYNIYIYLVNPTMQVSFFESFLSFITETQRILCQTFDIPDFPFEFAGTTAKEYDPACMDTQKSRSSAFCYREHKLG